MKEEFEHLKFHSVLCVSNTLNIDVTEMTAGENFHLLCSPEFYNLIFWERNFCFVSKRLRGGGGGFDTQGNLI